MNENGQQPPNGHAKKLFTTGQVAKQLGVAPRTVSEWIDSGRLKGFRIPPGRGTTQACHRRIKKFDLIAFLTENGLPLGDLTDEVRVLFVGVGEMADTIAAHLTDATYQFRSVESGFAAGEEIIDWHPAVVVLDFALGRNVCLCIATRIKSRDPLRRVVGLIGEDDSDLIRTFRTLGFDAGFQAPIDAAAVAGAVRELVGA